MLISLPYSLALHENFTGIGWYHYITVVSDELAIRNHNTSSISCHIISQSFFQFILWPLLDNVWSGIRDRSLGCVMRSTPRRRFRGLRFDSRSKRVLSCINFGLFSYNLIYLYQHRYMIISVAHLIVV